MAKPKPRRRKKKAIEPEDPAHDLVESMPSSPYVMERIMREVRHTLGDREFADVQEAQAHMEQIVGQDLGRKRQERLQDDPREQAQEYAYLAMETEDPDRAVAWVEMALKLDPRCLDALVMHTFLTEDRIPSLIERLQKAIEIGQEDLGYEFFAENEGDAWAMVEARPYLRSIKQLAELLWDTGHRLDAIEWYEELLDLDADDHQGNSRLLVASYLTAGELARTEETIDLHGEKDAFWHWARILLLILQGEEAAADKLRARANRLNPFVEDYLVGRKTTPERMAPTYAPGDESEAIVCAELLMQAWTSHPEAMFWLMDGQEELMDEPPAEPGPSSRKLH